MSDDKMDRFDRAINKCRGELAALESSRNDLDRALSVKREALAYMESAAGPDISLKPSPKTNPIAPSTDRPMMSGSLVSQIVALLEERGKPMRAGQIAKELKAAGATTSAKSGLLGMVCSSLLKRRDLFRKVKRGIYTLKSDSPKGE